MHRYARAMDRWQHPPRAVTPGEFVTQAEAAVALRCSPLVVGSLVAQGRLLPATLDGAPGVERESLEREVRWRRTTRFWRVRSLARAVAHWL